MHNDLNLLDPKDRELAAIRIVAKLPTLAAIAFRTANVGIYIYKGGDFNRGCQLFTHRRSMALLRISFT